MPTDIAAAMLRPTQCAAARVALAQAKRPQHDPTIAASISDVLDVPSEAGQFKKKPANGTGHAHPGCPRNWRRNNLLTAASERIHGTYRCTPIAF